MVIFCIISFITTQVVIQSLNMKYLLVLSCFLAVAYGVSEEALDKFKGDVMKTAIECKSEMGASDDDVGPLLKNEPPTTEKGKCFLACMHKKMGFQDASGKISKSGTDAAIDEIKAVDENLYAKMKIVADNCLSQVSDAANECETAFNIFVCVKKEEKAAGVTKIDWSS